MGAEEPDLLKMVIDDSIGVQTLAQQLNTPLETLNINDISSSSEIETAPVVPSCVQEDTISHMETSDEPMKKPRGRGRPRKERAANVVKRSRGRPSKLPSNVNDVMGVASARPLARLSRIFLRSLSILSFTMHTFEG